MIKLTRRQSLALISLLVALILLGRSAWIFWNLAPLEIPTSTPWNLFGIGLLAWVVGVLLLTSSSRDQPQNDPSFSAIPLAFIVAFAVVVRLYNFEHHPYGVWHDEAGTGLQAQYMLADSDYRPIFIGSMNVTAPHMMIYAVMLGLFGETNVQAIRLISVGFGVASVIVGYWVGHELRGHGFGVLMAAFLAVMRWSIHFSHIAMTGIDTVFFILLTLFFLLRLIKYGRLRDALWAGLAIAGGLWFYTAFRLALLAMGIGIIIAWRHRRPFSRTILLVLMIGVTSLLAIFPLLLFAYTNTDYFTTRMQVVSIYRPENRNTPDVNEAIWENLKTYAFMFHKEGDPRGMHNLHREPMLDDVMQIMMGIGLVIALIQVRWKWENLFFVGILIAGLIVGILTTQHEAPNAGRAIGVIPAVAFFCALAIWEVGAILWHIGIPQKILIAASCGIVIQVAYTNATLYYNVQARDFYSWTGFAIHATLIAERLELLDDEGYELYISDAAYSRDTTHFLIPDIFPKIHNTPLSDFFPVRIPVVEPIAVILSAEETRLFDYAKTLYPNANFETVLLTGIDLINIPKEPETAYYVIKLTPEDVASLQGLSENGHGYLYIEEAGTYQFKLRNGQTLRINGHVLTDEEPINLAGGMHYLETDSDLIWQRPYQDYYETVDEWHLYKEVAFGGLWGRFYPNETWSGSPAVERLDVSLNIYFHVLPLKRPYTAEWDGLIDIPETTQYDFRLWSVGYVELYLDNEYVLATPTTHQYVETSIYLEEGFHIIKVRFHDTLDYSEIRVEWRYGDDIAFTPIPSGNLIPQTTTD